MIINFTNLISSKKNLFTGSNTCNKSYQITPLKHEISFKQSNQSYKYLAEITGGFSKEMFEKFKIYYNEYLNHNDKLSEAKKLLINTYNSLISKLTLRQDGTPIFTKSFADEIKLITVKLCAINKLLREEEGCEILVPYSHWFKETSAGISNINNTEYFFEHPAYKAIRLSGLLTQDDYKDIEKLTKLYENMDLVKITKTKFRISKELYNAFKGKSPCFMNVFNNQEIADLKKKAKKHIALKVIQEKYGLSTNDLETFIFSGNVPNDISKYPIIEGLGIAINRVNFKNSYGETISGIIVFHSTDKNHEFTLYDESYLKNNKYLYKNIEWNNVDNLNKLNTTAKKIIQNNKDCMKISTIRFSLMNNDKFLHKMINKTSKPDAIDITKILKNYNQFYYISNFVNYNSKKYINGGRIIAKELLTFLKNYKQLPIIIRALAFNNGKHSPFKLYYRYGFIPYSHSMSEIEKLLKDNNNEFPIDEPVYMYLNNIIDIKTKL